MSEPYDDFDYDDFHDEDEVEDEFECGAWINGRFDYYSCQLAGTEDCDWECPHSGPARIAAMKKAQRE